MDTAVLLTHPFWCCHTLFGPCHNMVHFLKTAFAGVFWDLINPFLQPGYVTHSCALEVAALCGLPSQIIHRAKVKLLLLCLWTDCCCWHECCLFVVCCWQWYLSVVVLLMKGVVVCLLFVAGNDTCLLLCFCCWQTAGKGDGLGHTTLGYKPLYHTAAPVITCSYLSKLGANLNPNWQN